VLGQCTALTHLNLWANNIGDAGIESIVGVLPQCAALVSLDLGDNEGEGLQNGGVARLARVLTQCTALTHLDLSCNYIVTVGQGKLRDSWCGPAEGLRFEGFDEVEDEEEEEDFDQCEEEEEEEED
jgi:hypothetical protein